MAVLDPDEARDNIVTSITAVVIVAVLAWVSGISLSLGQIAAAVLVIAILGILVRTSGNVSIGFVLVTLAGILWIVDWIVPTSITDALSPIIGAVESSVGVTFAELPTFRLLILTVFLVTVALFFRFRFVQNVKGLDKIVDRVNRQFTIYFDTYAQIARAFVLLAFGLALVFFETAAQLAGEVGNVIAQVPIVVSNFATIVLGYIALGGDVPILSDIPFLTTLEAVGFAAIAITIIGLAAAARYEGRGPLAQYLKR